MPSIQSYLNYKEALKILLRTVGAGSAMQLLLMILAAILNNADKIYVGPGQALVVMICTTLASAIVGVRSTVRYLDQGIPLEQAAQTPADSQ